MSDAFLCVVRGVINVNKFEVRLLPSSNLKCTDLITIDRYKHKIITYINITVKIYLTDNKLEYGMYRLVEANARPIVYNAL